MKIRELAKTNNQSLLAIAVSIAALGGMWMKINSQIDDIVARSKSIQDAKIECAKHEIIHQNFRGEIDDIRRELRWIKRHQ